MRPKVVFAILLIAAVVLAGTFMLSKVIHSQPAVAPGPVATSPSNSEPVAAMVPAPVTQMAPASITITNRDTNAIAGQKTNHEEYVENRHEELLALAREGDPAGYQQILGELKNPDRGIQKAALDALEQANDRSFVPQMQQIADQTTDPDLKQAIQDAIDYINLPSLTEIKQQQKAQKAASGNQSPGTRPPRQPHPTRAGTQGANQ